MTLRRTGQGWKFVTEEVLEDFVWANLERLLGLTSLTRQYFVKGEICDILAVDDSKRLVVLELKNSEDRYIVQQLTRYYDNLLEDKPFQDKVDYSKTARLVAVAPTFHKHNFIDRKYNTLALDFLKFEVLEKNQKFYLQLKSIDEKQVAKLEIPYREIDSAIVGENIPTPPQILLEWLGSYTGEHQEAILKLRKQILSFDERIQELAAPKSIKYGKGRKVCAEFCFHRKSKEIVLFLWLRIPNYQKRQAIGRMQISTSDWSDYLKFAHVPQGILIKMELLYARTYCLIIEGKQVRGYLDELVDEALETWLQKL